MGNYLLKLQLRKQKHILLESRSRAATARLRADAFRGSVSTSFKSAFKTNFFFILLVNCTLSYSFKLTRHLIASVNNHRATVSLLDREAEIEVGYEETFETFEAKLTDYPPDNFDNSEENFGVNSSDCNMNIVEYYEMLLEKFLGNPIRIKEYLSSMGFTQTSFLYGKYQNLLEEKKIDYCQSLASLSSTWCSNGIIPTSRTLEEFLANDILRAKYIDSIIVLKYIELRGARYWKNVWAKEMRGVVLFVNPDTNNVSILSYKLPRGAEVVTGMVTNNCLETQDVKAGKINILDEEQQDTYQTLCNGTETNVYLTSKGDGSLLVINVYTGTTIQIMKPIVEIFGNEYCRLWMSQSLYCTNGQKMIIPATQGTVLDGGIMAPYMITSMLVGSKIASRSELEGKTYLQAWESFGSAWLKKFLQFTFFDHLTEVHTFSFEAICENRQGLFGDSEHIELACRYDADRLIFLGTV